MQLCTGFFSITNMTGGRTKDTNKNKEGDLYRYYTIIIVEVARARMNGTGFRIRVS